MIDNETYCGYDKEGNCKTRCTAVDATTEYINPEEVKKAIEDLEKTVSDGFKRIGKAISKVSCGKQTLSAADTSMQPVIDSVAESIAGGTSDDDVAPIAVQMSAALDDVYTRAVEAHNDIQKQLNSNAESSCWGTDVIRVC